MKPIDEYLKDIYPEATEQQIEHYLVLLEENDPESLPPTKEMVEFAELKEKANKIEDRLDELRLQIIEQKKRLNHNFQLISVTKTHPREFHADKFYDWVSTITDSNTLDELTIRTIDKKKFFQYESLNKISYEKLPDDCYTESEQWRLSVSKKKKK